MCKVTIKAFSKIGQNLIRVVKGVEKEKITQHHGNKMVVDKKVWEDSSLGKVLVVQA